MPTVWYWARAVALKRGPLETTCIDAEAPSRSQVFGVASPEIQTLLPISPLPAHRL